MKNKISNYLKKHQCPNCEIKLYTLKEKAGTLHYCASCNFEYLQSDVLGGFYSSFLDYGFRGNRNVR